MNTNYYLPIIFLFLLLFACEETTEKQAKQAHASKAQLDLSMDNLFAWCVVPFDRVEREPQARVDMLRELGFKAYAYDWREKHLAEMEEEWKLAEANGLDVMAVWLWVDANNDQPGKLSESNEQVLKTIAMSKLQTQVWVGFNANYFQDFSEEERIKRGVEMVSYLHKRVEDMGSKLALYNHGDWFGEPSNQVKVIEAIPTKDVGIIYNFHHAHLQIDRFATIVESMLPYLWAVNLNGLKKGGPKILPIGEGDHEASMLKILQEHGYEGPFGILGHVEDADVREILKKNLSGLKAINM